MSGGHFGQAVMKALDIEKLETYIEDEEERTIRIEIHDYSCHFGVTFGMLERLAQLLGTKEISFDSHDGQCSGVTPDTWRRVVLNVKDVVFPEETTDADIRICILNQAGGLADDFLYYDRKEDEDLPRGVIQDAVKRGVVSLKEIVYAFEKELHKKINWEAT